MLNDIEFSHYCNRLNLPEFAVKYIERLRASGPSRKVRCGPNNVIAQYPSRKMARMVPAESHTVELTFIQQLEHDDDVIEYYAQPFPIKLNYASASGRPVGVVHTPDFLVLETNTAGWVECKTQESLNKLGSVQPHRYRGDDKGQWRCPPGEEAANPLGLYYKVWNSAEADPTVMRNMRFLEDYFDPEYPEVPVALKESVLGTVKRCPGMMAQTLVEKVNGCSYEHLYTLIGKGVIYVELKEAPLTCPERVRLHVDECSAVAHRFAQQSRISGATVPGFPQISPLLQSGSPILSPQVPETVLDDCAEALLRSARPKDMEFANKRFQLIYGETPSALTAVPSRTLRRWKRLYRLAELTFGCGYVGLLPKFRFRGNHGCRFPAELLELADHVIEEHFEKNKRKTKQSTFSVLQLECEKRGLPSPSYRWLTKRIRTRRNTQTTEDRDGSCLPEKSEQRIVTNGTLAHGERPWDVVHIDHTPCDIELVDDISGLLLGRPWLTLAFDAYSRRILAFHLTFDHPSYVSCLMVLRECCRRHERLPSCVVVDGGPEFRHLYFESFCACYQITLKTRPAARPYFGSVIEKMFGTLETEFFRNLAGNTHILKTASKITSANSPHKEAVWTLESLHALFSEYCFELYDRRIHPAFNVTPEQRYQRGMEVGGLRQRRRVVYDENLIAMTLPTTPKGTAIIQQGSGVKINGIYYWSDEMRKPGLLGSKVPVRYDPFNLAVAYAYISERWVKCISVHAEAFQGRSEKELKIASTTLLRGNKASRQERWLSARKLAEFFMSLEGEERLRKQHLKDLAAHRAARPKGSKTEPVIDFAI